MSIINEIRIVHSPLIDASRSLPRRDFYSKVDWSDRLIGILGAKGVGKTTLMLQRLAEMEGESLYFSLDQTLASAAPLQEIAQDFYQAGGRVLFIDEVHKFPDWSLQTKNIYDTLPKLFVVFSGSSLMRMHSQSGDLSRRASMYYMPVLSFREFLRLEGVLEAKALALDDLLSNSHTHASKIVATLQPIPLFRRYLEHGAYPFYRDGLARYHDKLRNSVLYTVETDLVQVHQLDPRYIPKIKKLIRMLAEEVPFTPNISSLSQALEVSRASMLRYLELLDLAGILTLLQRTGRGYQKLSKPEKIFLANTNLLKAFAPIRHETGTVRETFAVSQLRSAELIINAPRSGDFLVEDRYLFEVGGRNKNASQLKGKNRAYVIRDNIEVGAGNVVPLWLLGFLY